MRTDNASLFNRFLHERYDIWIDGELRKEEFEAIVINKRHYNENNRNLFYVSFSFNDKEEEFLVSECIYNTLSINQKGVLILKYDYFEDKEDR